MIEEILSDDTSFEKSWLWRNVHIAKELACSLITDRGEIDRRALKEAIDLLEGKLFCLLPGAHLDDRRQRYLLATLKKLQKNRALASALKKISAPHWHRGAAALIRQTLGLSEGKQLTAADARRAALAAWLTFLRQSVGSCFATAPAIVIQLQDPLRFLQDLDDLIAKGELTRLIDGVEHTAPLCPTVKSGESPLLKAWEYTLASLSESHANFAKWNLYISLGVEQHHPHGIGEAIYTALKELIEGINEQIEISQSHYEHLFAQVKLIEGRMRRASSDTEAAWLRADYSLRRQEIDRALRDRDRAAMQGQAVSQLYPRLIEYYGKKIRDYFQEVYDAEMHDLTSNPYDDSPAGFRLLYKHGRTLTTSWTPISSPEEYLDSLTAFFVSTEVDLATELELEGLEKELSRLVTTIITVIRRPEFLESSFARLAAAYNEPLPKNPLEHLDQVARKPWAYLSGGTMQTLVSSYFCNPNELKQETTWVERPVELLAFFIDTMKNAPGSVQTHYLKDPDAGMLAFTPTHAYVAKPGWFQEAWESTLYTYTWIRDVWLAPTHRFLDDHLLTPEMSEHLLQRFPPEVRAAVGPITYSLRANELRDRIPSQWAEDFDSLLYESLPLFPSHQLEDHLHTIFEALGLSLPTFDAPRYRCFTATDLREIAKALLVEMEKSSRFSLPYHDKIVKVMRDHALAYPAPLLVGDTNWVHTSFGFLLNPGTSELDFWRLDESGVEGKPLTIWRRYFDGREKGVWGFYTNPSQYSQI